MESSNFETIQTIDDKIVLSSKDRFSKIELDKLLLNKARDMYVGRYTKYGYIINVIKLNSWSKPYRSGSEFNSNMYVKIRFLAKVLLPKIGGKLIGHVKQNVRPQLTIVNDHIIGIVPKINDQEHNIDVGNKVICTITDIKVTDKKFICICKDPEIYKISYELYEIDKSQFKFKFKEISLFFHDKPIIVNNNVDNNYLDQIYNDEIIKTNVIKLNNIKNDYYRFHRELINNIKMFSNKYGLIQQTINSTPQNIFYKYNNINEKVVNKSYYKFYEILNILPNEILISNESPINYISLTNDHGGFIQAFIDFIDNNDIKNDKIIGYSMNDWKIKGKIPKQHESKVTLHKSNDYNEIIKSFLNNKVELISSNNSVKDFAYQTIELDNIILFYCEVYTAIRIQKNKGTFILKIYDTYFNSTISILRLLDYFYRQIYVYKPNTSSEENSERFFICTDFNEDLLTDEIINILSNVYNEILKNKDKYLISMFDLNIDDEFKLSIDKYNRIYYDCQILMLNYSKNEINQLIKNKNRDELTKILLLNIEKCDHLLNTLKIEYSKKQNIVSKIIRKVFKEVEEEEEEEEEELVPMELEEPEEPPLSEDHEEPPLPSTEQPLPEEHEESPLSEEDEEPQLPSTEQPKPVEPVEPFSPLKIISEPLTELLSQLSPPEPSPPPSLPPSLPPSPPSPPPEPSSPPHEPPSLPSPSLPLPLPLPSPSFKLKLFKPKQNK